MTRSELESRFLRMCRRFGIPRPERNADIEGKERDFVWRDARLVVEVDGHATHGTRFAFEDDRARDLTLVRAGWRVVRLTHAQIVSDAADVAAALRDLLGGPFRIRIANTRGPTSVPGGADEKRQRAQAAAADVGAHRRRGLGAEHALGRQDPLPAREPGVRMQDRGSGISATPDS